MHRMFLFAATALLFFTLPSLAVDPPASTAPAAPASGSSGIVTTGPISFNFETKIMTYTAPDKSTRMWDLVTGRELRILWRKGLSFNRVTFSPGKKRVLIIGDDKVAALYDATTGKPLFNLSVNANCAAFSIDGKQILIGTSDKIAEIWNGVTGKLMQQFIGHTGAITGVAISADAKFIATACADHTFRQWDAVTGKKTSDFLEDKGEIRSITISPDGGLITCGYQDGFARAWNPKTQISKNFSVPEPMMAPVVQVSNDGKTLLMRNDRNICFTWDYNTAVEIKRMDAGPVPLSGLKISANGEVLATSAGRVAITWDTATGRQLKRFPGHTDLITGLAISEDGSMLITGSLDSTGWVWNAKQGGEIKRLVGTMKKITAVDISPDKKWAITGGIDGKSYQWDVNTGVPQRELGGGGSVVGVGFSPTGKEAVIASGGISLWDITTKKSIREIGNVRGVKSISMSYDHSQFVAVDDRSVFLFSLGGGGGTQTYTPRNGTPTCGAMSKDRQTVAIGTDSGAVLLYSGSKELFALTAHTGGITAVAFTPDNKIILSASEDGSTRLWDVATGKELCAVVSFATTSWIVYDPAGHYESSNFGDVTEMFEIYNVPEDDVRSIKNRYFEEGLLAKCLGRKKESTATKPASAPATHP